MLNPKTQCDGVEHKAFGRWLGHKGRVLLNEINTLMKESQKNSLPLPCKDTYKRRPSMNQESGLHQMPKVSVP